MKRLITIFLVLLMASTVYAAARYDVKPSTAKTASADAIIKGEGYFHGIIVTTDATNAQTVDVYDSLTAAAGTIELIPTWTVTTSSTDRVQSISVDPPVFFRAGESNRDPEEKAIALFLSLSKVLRG